MPSLAPITLENGSVIYVQATDEVAVPEESLKTGGRVSKGPAEALQRSYETLKDTITGYTSYVIEAFDELGRGNVDKVTLEFGVTVGGKMGVPYITEGTAKGSLKVTVECSWPRPTSDSAPAQDA